MKTLRIILFIFIGFSILAAGGLFGVYHWATKDLPSFKKITDYTPPLVTTVYAKDGEVLGYFYKEKRFLVRLDDMSKMLPMAFLAAEDSAFYDHEGVDLMAIFRAVIVNMKSGRAKQGGSTITQQIIKQLLLTNEKSYERKIKEAILAYRLESYLTKEEILTIYLNQIYLGARSYGVEAASRKYFGKHVNELSLAECAVLAGLPQAPSRYNPLDNPQAARERQEYVLGQMFELGWIDLAQYTEALEEELVYTGMEDPSWTVGAYYLEEVRRKLIDIYGEEMVYTGGLNVYTACEMDHQLAAETALQGGLEAYTHRRGWLGPIENISEERFEEFKAETDVSYEEYEHGDWIRVLVVDVSPKAATVVFGNQTSEIPVSTMAWCRTPNFRVPADYAGKVKNATKVLNKGDVVWASIQAMPVDDKTGWKLALEQKPEVEGAIVSIDPVTGNVVALSGGYDYMRSEFNRATQAKRQPGSAFKPIVYSVAMDNGFTPASIIVDAPIVFENTADGTLWRPENYENKFYGPTLLRTALVKSRNLVTVRLAQKLGIGKIIQRARDMGLETEFPPDLSVALGSASVSLLNMCQAYTTFARGGSYVNPRFILRVDDAWGREIYKTETESVDAISPQTAFIMASIMKEVVQSGTGYRAKILGRPIAGKTGTTNEERDTWFMGYSPYLLTGVYVGFDVPSTLGKLESGSRTASPIWVNYRKEVEERYPVQDFVKPEGVVMARVDGKTGKLAGPGSEESFFLPFKAGTQPTVMDQSGSHSFEGGTGSEDDLLKQGF